MSADLGDKDCHAWFLHAVRTAHDAAKSLSKPPIGGIIIFGTDRTQFTAFVTSMKQARDACRGIALTRPDYETAAKMHAWLQIARICQEAADKAEKLFINTASGKSRFAWTQVAKQLEGMIHLGQQEFNRSVASRRMQG